MKELEEPKIENDMLKSSLEDTNKTIVKFVEEEKNPNMLQNQQKLLLDKGAIGYNGKHKDRNYRSSFVKATQSTFNCCGKLGHIFHTCAIRNNMNGNVKKRYIWVPKDQVHLIKTNPEGPKHKTVPKI